MKPNYEYYWANEFLLYIYYSFIISLITFNIYLKLDFKGFISNFKSFRKDFYYTMTNWTWNTFFSIRFCQAYKWSLL